MKDRTKRKSNQLLEIVGLQNINIKNMSLEHYYNNKQFLDALPTMLGAVGNTLIDPYTAGLGRPSGKVYYNANKSLGGYLLLNVPASASIGRIFIQLSSGVVFTLVVKRLDDGAPSTIVIPIPYFKVIGNAYIPQEHETSVEDTVTYSFYIVGWNAGYNSTYIDKTAKILSGEVDIVQEFLELGGTSDENDTSLQG